MGGGVVSEPLIESDLKGVTKILRHEGTKDYRKSSFGKILQRLHIVTDHSPLTTHSSLKKAAFTLAEVLITIAIIGVVAALTIGNLVTNYKKHEAVVGLKKMYNTFSNALERAEVDHGDPTSWTFDDYNDFSAKYIEPYVEGVYQFSYKNHSKNTANVNAINISLYNRKTRCMKNGICYTGYMHGFIIDSNGIPQFTYFFIAADYNGEKGPNRAGRDIFFFTIDKVTKKLSFYQYPTDQNLTREQLLERACNKTNTGWSNGWACTAVIIRDGWKIKDDYPW